MDWFKSILQLLGAPCHPVRGHFMPRPDALELSELRNLPDELIFNIARFLPPESTVSFSLCCRPIYFTFGPQVFRNLAQSSRCFEFLTLLAQDLPDHVPCYYCKTLHAIEKAQLHIFSAHRDKITWLRCWKADYRFTLSHLHRNFSFTIFQMAMKRYSQGLNYSELLNLLSCKETHYRNGHVKHYTALARIVHGSMIVRKHKIVIVSMAKPSLTWGNQRVNICPHISLIWNPESQGLHSIVERFESHKWDIPRNDWNWQGLIRQCPHCLTDFSLEFEQVVEKVEAVFVTTWQDLGQGRSPMDYKWQSHVACSAELPWIGRGSVCAMFEGKRRSRFESISFFSHQDKKELLGLLERK